MQQAVSPYLQRLLALAPQQPQYRDLALRLTDLAPGDSQGRLALYEAALALAEQALWARADDAERLAIYQGLFREREALLGAASADPRHHFVVVIPVADRPQHLEACLTSLLALCHAYEYGGRDAGGRYRKVSVLVADDTEAADNIARNRQIAARFDAAGLATRYFGIAQQLAAIARLGTAVQGDLARVLGTNDPQAFAHKGASVMRNIAYLALQEMVADGAKPLFFFVDSDQEFQVKVEAGGHDLNIPGLNYFQYLDRVFRETPTQVLTGKVVGDPPVSPAVMTGRLLDDLLDYLNTLARSAPAAACAFHGQDTHAEQGAAYHDMADLFGFHGAGAAYRYRCRLHGAHDNRACLGDFAEKLPCFFDGEHPTRATYFEYRDVIASLVPARTLYTGNYVLAPAALKYFIPFSNLRLRMAGPVLGRILRAELGASFVSANLPMLHKRTVAHIGRSEFRPGVRREADRVDLSGEFERQFFGDVMLFSMERLSAAGYPATALETARIESIVADVETEMLQRYREKRVQIATRLTQVRVEFSDGQHWWNQADTDAPASRAIDGFLDNVAHNFGDRSRAFALIDDPAHRAQRRRQIVDGIARYRDDRVAWERALRAMSGGALRP